MKKVMKNKKVDKPTKSPLRYLRIRQRRGWIRIFEAVIALLLIIGVILTLASQGHILREDISEKVYDLQIGVLREIEKNQELRQEILEIDENANTPHNIQSIINERMPEHLVCESKICGLDKICSLANYPEKNVYARSVAITATASTYNPKQLRMFCWVK